MSMFILKRSGDEDAVSEKNHNNSNESPEINNSNGVDNNVSGSSNNTEPNSNNDSFAGKQKTIVVDGPLSEVFTQGLLQYYSKDADKKQSAETMSQNASMQSILMLQAIDEGYLNNNSKDVDLYVYVDDGDNMEISDGLNLIKTVESIKERDVNTLVVLESSNKLNKLNKYMCSAESFSLSRNVNVVHSRNSAYNFISNII